MSETDEQAAASTPDAPPQAQSAQPFFRSRWAPRPAHVSELGLDAGLPDGFRAAGVIAGIKPSGRRDVGLLVCDAQSPV
ncbi:MAG TPA: hypothetical protein VED41_00220, partial [Solirubrobacteraceae bacterium]|nr:hypothetical protein [Solirubrobacteraceae bacterium]